MCVIPCKGVAGALTVLMKDAIKPNLMQVEYHSSSRPLLIDD
jgi:formyltetrahydrofolate synthetase